MAQTIQNVSVTHHPFDLCGAIIFGMVKCGESALESEKRTLRKLILLFIGKLIDREINLLELIICLHRSTLLMNL
jgi:hypothetical protein